MRLLGLAICLALFLPADALSAQERTGRVRGIVVDSLLGDVLPGAEVRIDKLSRRAATDEAGRFAFDAVPPGEWSVTFSHPALDSIGVTGSTSVVRVFAGVSATTTLATPTFEAVRNRLCGHTPDSLSPTVAYGSVHAADGSRVRVKVSVSWMLGSMTGASNPGTVRTVPEGDRQLWVACGVPRRSWFHASVRDSTRSASAFLQIGPRDLVMHDLVLSARTGTLEGSVSDGDGRPVSGARVSVEGTALNAASDAAGNFVLPEVSTGTITVDVRAAGFAPWVTAIQGSAKPVTVRLRPLRIAEESDTRGSDYLRLLQRSHNQQLQVLTGAALTGDSEALVALPIANVCRWWLDGRPVQREFFLAQPRWSWRALELYLHGQHAPPEYRSTGCPVDLLWTATSDW